MMVDNILGEMGLRRGLAYTLSLNGVLLAESRVPVAEPAVQVDVVSSVTLRSGLLFNMPLGLLRTSPVSDP
jgi:hypothetical protein